MGAQAEPRLDPVICCYSFHQLVLKPPLLTVQSEAVSCSSPAGKSCGMGGLLRLLSSKHQHRDLVCLCSYGPVSSKCSHYPTVISWPYMSAGKWPPPHVVENGFIVGFYAQQLNYSTKIHSGCFYCGFPPVCSSFFPWCGHNLRLKASFILYPAAYFLLVFTSF